MPASPPTTPQLGLPRFAADMSTAIWNGLNQIVDMVDSLYAPWTYYTPNWSQSDGTTYNNLAIGNGILEGRYSKVGKVVHWMIYWERGSTTDTGVALAYSFSLPPGFPPRVWNRNTGSLAMTRGGSHYGGSVFPTTSTSVGGIVGDLGRINSGLPGTTHNVGDWMVMSGTYETS